MRQKPVTRSLRRPFTIVRQQGFSLLEVLIAVLVLAVGVLGALLMQTNALRYSASASDHTQASFIVYDMLDRMRANPVDLQHYATRVQPGCSDAPATTSILATDLADFAHAVRCLLPGGHGGVAIDGQHATVTVSWSEARIVAGAGPTSLVVAALIGGDP